MSSAMERNRDFAWASSLLRFNLHVARFAHRSWYEHAAPGSFPAALIGSDGRVIEQAEPQVSAWLLRSLGLQQEWDWTLAEPEKRLWLIDITPLDRLMRVLSLAMHRQWLARVIGGAQFRSLQEAVGREDLRFVLSDVPRDAVHHETSVVSFEGDAASIARGLRDDGAHTLLSLLPTAWRAVRARALLHFERTETSDNEAPLAADRRDRVTELLCERVIPRRLPEWAWLF